MKKYAIIDGDKTVYIEASSMFDAIKFNEHDTTRILLAVAALYDLPIKEEYVPDEDNTSEEEE